jgi:fructan beta-fructosidase
MKHTLKLIAALLMGAVATFAHADEQGALKDKTLVSWVAPANLTQRGGSALTIQRGDQFDGIVFGEKVAGKWMAGSYWFSRTQDNQQANAAETADAKTLIQMAIVYKGNQIAIYRNGEPYVSYEANNIDLLSAKDNMAVFGLRHLGATTGQNLQGSIEDARIYDRALAVEEIRKLEPDKESATRPYAWWTFEQGRETDLMGRFPVNSLAGGARIEGGRLVLQTDGAVLIASGAAAPSALPSDSETYRPQFHFTPSQGWMNDPCGMFYHDGDFHLHYLWNRELGGWGKDWAQVVSRDLVHWTPWPVSISNDPVLGECWSGSGLVDADNTGGFKTGKEDVLVLVFTINSASEGQAVGLAYSNDRGRTWTRYAQNPVIRRLDENKDYRDPKVFWHAPSAKWILVLSRGYTAPGNIYSSSDLKHWTLLGEMPNGECPDLFELPIEGRPSETKWVYAAGDFPAAPNGAGAKYFLGDFDGKAFGNRSSAHRFGGNFFVGQSFSQVPPADGRRIWMGWKWLNPEKYGTLGPWAGGIQTIPVALTLRDIPGAGLRLCYNPVKELQGLRDEHFHFERQAITQGGSLLSSRRIQGELLEIIARFQLDTAAEFGLQLRKGTQGHCTVGYDTAKQEVFFNPEAGPNRTSQALAPRDKVVQLHVLLDRSVVDIFGNDGLTWNCEFFKADPKSLGVELYAKGGTVQLLSLDLWKLKSR